jgi:hypothetical protein
LPVGDFLIYGGAKFICPVCGAITLMPGTGSDPAYRRVDVDVKTGKVTCLSTQRTKNSRPFGVWRGFSRKRLSYQTTGPKAFF